MNTYYLVRKAEGVWPEVLWRGDDYNQACDQYDKAVDDPANRGCYLMLTQRVVGRYVFAA